MTLKSAFIHILQILPGYEFFYFAFSSFVLLLFVWCLYFGFKIYGMRVEHY